MDDADDGDPAATIVKREGGRWSESTVPVSQNTSVGQLKQLLLNDGHPSVFLTRFPGGKPVKDTDLVGAGTKFMLFVPVANYTAEDDNYTRIRGTAGFKPE